MKSLLRPTRTQGYTSEGYDAEEELRKVIGEWFKKHAENHPIRELEYIAIQSAMLEALDMRIWLDTQPSST